MTKEFYDFAINKSNGKDGRRSICKSCINESARKQWAESDQDFKNNRYEQTKQWAENNQDKYFGPDGYLRRSRLKVKYGLSVEDWELKFQSQDYRCACCQTDNFGLSGPMTDHDHSCCSGIKTCGKCVRGIVCHQCNVTIGFVENGWPIIIPAIEEYLKLYLERR